MGLFGDFHKINLRTETDVGRQERWDYTLIWNMTNALKSSDASPIEKQDLISLMQECIDVFA